MPISYGRQNVINYSPQRVGNRSAGKLDVTLIRNLVTAGEIIVSLIPGVNIVGELTAGLVAGSIFQYLDSYTGHTNVVNTLLNFGLPIGQYNFTRFKEVRKANQIVTSNFRITDDFSDISPTLLPLAKTRNINAEISATNVVFSGKSKDVDLFYKELQSKLNENFKKAIADLPEELSATGAILTSQKKIIEELISEAKAETFVTKRSKGSNNMFKKQGFSDEQATEINNILSKAISQREKTMALKELDEYFQLLISSNQLSKAARQFISRYESLLATVGEQAPVESVLARVIIDGGNKTVPRQWWKAIGSRGFNDRWVQKLQLIDPNDLGRAPVEALYQRTKRYLDDAFKQTRKRLSPVLKKAKNIETAFTKTGGVLLDSDWLLGYKVITATPATSLILIKFIPSATNAKRDVIVWATPFQIKQLIASPGKSYLRYWALSRGGAPVSLTNLFGGLSFGRSSLFVSNVLGFIPVPQLRHILSIVSNWVENVADIANGDYAKNYFDKLKRSFINTSISRSFRILAKGVVGNYAKQAFGNAIGRFIGFELQRLGTNIGAYAIKAAISGRTKNLGARLSKNLAHGIVTSVRSNSLRTLRRRKPNSLIAQTLSARRRFRQINRIPNAVVPKRPYKGFRL